MKIQTIWIGLFILAGGCYCAYFSAPRSATEFGSKRLLNSFSTLDTQLKITEYNEDLSLNTTHNILRPENSDWTDVKSCDQYYLALATSNIGNSVTLLLLSPLNSLGSDLRQTKIHFNMTRQYSGYYIAVAPSGRNFVFLNGTHLIVFEVEPQSLNWTIIAEENVWVFINIAVSDLAMSDSKISFIYIIDDSSSRFSYNYKTKTKTERDLPFRSDAVGSIDTYNDYWLYSSSSLAILEYPNGDLFNFSYSSTAAFILPSQLSTTKEYIDIATIYESPNFVDVTLGTLNSATHAFEQYNVIPSKSLGLLYNYNADPSQLNLLQFGIGHSVLMYQLPDKYASVALAVPSLAGNHSCSMRFNYRMDVFWCATGGVDRSPTEQCPRGTYQPSTGYTTCLLCPEGTYQPKEGSIDCLKCKENEYCPVGSFKPEVLSNSSSHITWDFPISETATSFEEILLMLLFATSITSTSISFVLLGCIIITAALLLSLLVKYFCGVSLHQWLAKIDIHKKTKTRTTTMAKPNGTFKTETIKVESVFGGYLTLIAAFILLVGLITTIIYVNDYHPLLVGQDSKQTPSQNSLRTSSLQDYSTQSQASELANVLKDYLQLNITIRLYNFQAFDGQSMPSVSVKNCYDQYGNDCTSRYSYAIEKHGSSAIYNMQLAGSIQSTDADVIFVLGDAVTFTWATLEISSSHTNEEKFRTSTAKYLILPGQGKVLTGLLRIPVTMTIVVRETELQEGEFDNNGYVSFVADESKLRNLGHDTRTFAMTNDPITLQLVLQLDNNWRLESEQRRFSGVGAFFAALLAILGLYEVTLLASELAHRIFHAIEKRRKKRSKYQSLEDPPFIVNEKSE